jgi:hypothetical protein
LLHRRRPPRALASVPPGGAVIEICDSPAGCVDPTLVMSALGGTFDITDELLRLHGEDPYGQEKARFLAATSSWRLELARRDASFRRQSALIELPRRLDRLWADARFSPGERRRLLFYLWLEMDGSPDGVRGAAAIEEFIRANLPTGTPHAFSAAELARLNELSRPRTFAPYRSQR